MTQLTSDEQTVFNTAFSEEMVASHANELALVPMASTESLGLGGMAPKDLFCKNWDSAAAVLGTIADLVPNLIVRGALKIVIAAGNALKKAIC